MVVILKSFWRERASGTPRRALGKGSVISGQVRTAGDRRKNGLEYQGNSVSLLPIREFHDR